MCDRQNQIRHSLRLYRLLLCLYPLAFRRQFGCQLSDLFEQWLKDESARHGTRGVLKVWRVTLSEYVPTLFREHVAAFDARASLRAGVHHLRTLMASLPVVAAFAVLLQFTKHPDDGVVLSLWFLCLAGGMAVARGRGWACSRNAMLGAMAGIGLPILWVGLTESSTPNVFSVAPLLLGAAATIGLILSTFVRLILEGLRLRGSPCPTCVPGAPS